MRCGFIGLGHIGKYLAGSLVRNGFEVTVYDLDPKAVEGLVAKGAKAATSIKVRPLASVPLVPPSSESSPAPPCSQSPPAPPTRVSAPVPPSRVSLRRTSTTAAGAISPIRCTRFQVNES